jgi:hypothetical protein
MWAEFLGNICQKYVTEIFEFYFIEIFLEFSQNIENSIKFINMKIIDMRWYIWKLHQFNKNLNIF